MHEDMTFNAWRVLQRSKELDQRPKEQKLNYRNPSSSKWNDCLEWLSWEVRRRLEEWEPEIHIYKELRALNTFFNNMLFSPKFGLLFLAQLPRSSSFSFLLILLRAWNLEQWGLRWPKAPQWWQAMCLGPLDFLGKDLVTWFCSLFNLWHWCLIWPITLQWWQVGKNLDPIKAFDWGLNGGFNSKAFLYTFWFLLCGGMYTDLSFEVKHIIGIKLSTTTWLQ